MSLIVIWEKHNLHSSVVLLKVRQIGSLSRSMMRFTFQCGSTEGHHARGGQGRVVYLHSSVVLLKVGCVFFGIELEDYLHSSVVLLKAYHLRFFLRL